MNETAVAIVQDSLFLSIGHQGDEPHLRLFRPAETPAKGVWLLHGAIENGRIFYSAKGDKGLAAYLCLEKNADASKSGEWSPPQFAFSYRSAFVLRQRIFDFVFFGFWWIFPSEILLPTPIRIQTHYITFAFIFFVVHAANPTHVWLPTRERNYWNILSARSRLAWSSLRLKIFRGSRLRMVLRKSYHSLLPTELFRMDGMQNIFLRFFGQK